MFEKPTSAVIFNSQTAKDLIKQTQDIIDSEGVGSEKYEALLGFKMALEKVLPYLPGPRIAQPDEIELEQEIREEIVIAGANENG